MKKLLFVMSTAVLMTRIAIGSDTYIVQVTPPSLIVGETGTLFWDTPPGASTWFDWIGVYPPGNPLQAAHVLTIYGGKSGTNGIIFNSVGDFDLQYFDSGGVALSEPFLVTIRTDPSAFSLSLTTNQVPIDSQIAVTWQSATNLSTTSDAIGYFNERTPTTLVASVPVEGRHSGTAYFTMGKPGHFQFAYFKSGKIDNPVTPFAPLEVSTTGTKPTLQVIGNSVRISWFAYKGATYRLRDSTNLLSGPVSSWHILQTSTGGGATQTVSTPYSSPTKFFALEETWP